MRKTVTAICLTLCMLSALAAAVCAQTPFVAVYFDATMQQEAMIYPGSCPPFGTIDTLFVAAVNFNMFMAGIEYSIDYGNNVSWLADFDFTAPVWIGNSPMGISIGWNLPQNGFSAVRIQKVLIQWICNNCQFTNDPIIVKGHPLFHPGYPVAVRFPDYVEVPGVGLTALTCPTIPVEESTWGQVKALYSGE
jgi:hypothetical protein